MQDYIISNHFWSHLAISGHNYHYLNIIVNTWSHNWAPGNTFKHIIVLRQLEILLLFSGQIWSLLAPSGHIFYSWSQNFTPGNTLKQVLVLRQDGILPSFSSSFCTVQTGHSWSLLPVPGHCWQPMATFRTYLHYPAPTGRLLLHQM